MQVVGPMLQAVFFCKEETVEFSKSVLGCVNNTLCMYIYNPHPLNPQF